MGAYTTTLLMAYSRIRANMESGRSLHEKVKRLRVGPRIDTVLPSDVPMVVLGINRIAESYQRSTARDTLTADIEIGIRILYPTFNRRDANRLFQTGFIFDASLLNVGVFREEDYADTGILFLMELIADSINTGYENDNTPKIDPRLAERSAKAITIDWGTIEAQGDSFLICDGIINASPPDFTINGRSTTTS